ncbi:hypothetical protein VHEMI02151 [[Torrubiella] hemipterigena]|uniref:Uncharacterized protein n=1 Tax=[Torrubiella] hemipterigena TaxID=1531966 RepID=A0A0A1T7B1_9HYPO|nr:hypothetical protein VHEMI02151 [[Torrubiella] hemipterigena]
MKFTLAFLAIINSVAFAMPATDSQQLGLHSRGVFPPGEEAKYIKACEQTAGHDHVDPGDAKKACECAAAALKKNFTDAEIKELVTEDGANLELFRKAEKAVFKACEK